MSPRCFWITKPTIALLCLIALASLLAGVGASPCFAVEKGPKEVLVLHSYHAGLNWTDDVMEGIWDVFSRQPTPPNVYVEYMDSKRNESPEYLAEILEDFLTRKLKTRRSTFSCSRTTMPWILFGGIRGIFLLGYPSYFAASIISIHP